MSDVFDKAPSVSGIYTESKLVVIDWDVSTRQFLANGVRTYNNVNVEIDKFLKDGWTPVNICFSNGSYTILFCR